jgi:SAM-dependent methyltransferase
MGSERAKEFARDLFDRQAVRFETTFAGRHSARMKEAALACVKPRRGTVLDVGCGPGLLLAMLAESPELKLAGLDIAPEMVRIANGTSAYACRDQTGRRRVVGLGRRLVRLYFLRQFFPPLSESEAGVERISPGAETRWTSGPCRSHGAAADSWPDELSRPIPALGRRAFV